MLWLRGICIKGHSVCIYSTTGFECMFYSVAYTDVSECLPVSDALLGVVFQVPQRRDGAMWLSWGKVKSSAV